MRELLVGVPIVAAFLFLALLFPMVLIMAILLFILGMLAYTIGEGIFGWWDDRKNGV